MLINEIINNSELNLNGIFIINSFNEDTGEVKTVYRSWIDNNVPFDICMKQCNMIESKTIGDFNYPCIVLEYTE